MNDYMQRTPKVHEMKDRFSSGNDRGLFPIPVCALHVMTAAYGRC